MSDKEWISEVKKITDPMKMLQTIVDNENFLGYDSYYKDLRETMLSQAYKICYGNEDVPC